MINGIPIAGLTAPTILGLGILLVLFGRLIPQPMYKEKAAEAERWRQAYEVERTARAAADAQTAELLEVARTTHNIVAAVFGDGRFNNKRIGAPDVAVEE